MKLSELFRARSLSILNTSKYKDKDKILYIGSRINVKEDIPPILGESGSLFDKSFIQKLKSYNIKIVVCCLEYKFFKRSVLQLNRAYHMLVQQLFLADKIHFLTQSDKIDFEATLRVLKKEAALYALPQVNAWVLEQIEKITELQRLLAEEEVQLATKQKVLEELKKSQELLLKSLQSSENQNKEEGEKKRKEFKSKIKLQQTRIEERQNTIIKIKNKLMFLNNLKKILNLRSNPCLMIWNIKQVKVCLFRVFILLIL